MSHQVGLIPKRCLGPLSQTLKPWTPKSDVGHHGMMVPNREIVFWVAQPAISSFTRPRNDKSAINLSNYRYILIYLPYIYHKLSETVPLSIVGTFYTLWNGFSNGSVRNRSTNGRWSPLEKPWYSGEIQPWCSHETPNEMEVSNPWGYPVPQIRAKSTNDLVLKPLVTWLTHYYQKNIHPYDTI